MEFIVPVKSFFGEAPEAFYAVDVCSSSCIRFGLLYLAVFPVVFQALVAFEVVGVEHWSLLGFGLDLSSLRAENNDFV